jgi:long-chain acyl-CoA synthetase
MLLDVAAARPDAIAIDDLERRRTWAELVDRATRVGRLLLDGFGLQPGDHVTAVMGNRVELVELVYGALLSGIWLTPANWHLTADELGHVIDDSGARVVITDDTFAAVTRQAAGERPVLVAGGDLDAQLATASDEPFALDEPAGGNMFYTSGTTGRPKGVKRSTKSTVGDQLGAIASSGRLLGLDGVGPHLVTGPLYHAAPLGFAVMDQGNGAPMVVQPRFDEAVTLSLIAEHVVRNTHLVPTMFVRLLRLPDDVRDGFDPTSLRTVLHGAAPISVAVKQRMIEWWGPVLVEYWGASEGGVVTLTDSADWLTRPGTVGRAIATHEVFAADPDGRRLAPGETGTLWCRNLLVDDVFSYHNDPAKTAEAFSAPGTYTLGDIGRVDEDGYVYLADRASNMIISGGVNIYPAEIEQVLIEHPAVADVAVFGIPDDEWGESVKAAVELVDGHEPSTALEAEILTMARAHLAGYKVPRSIDFADELPRQPSGKLFVRRLRQPYWEGRERHI